MKFIAHIAVGMALGVGMVSATMAEPAQIKLPPEVAKLRTSKLPGYIIAMQKCSICHSADYVSYQPPGMSQTQWTAEMAKMQHAYGAPISDDEVKQLGAYLAVAYGSAKASDAEVVAASKLSVAVPMPLAPVSGASTGSAVAAAVPAGTRDSAPSKELMVVLSSNACLGCHAIAQKIVGPAYKDVALKYKGDTQAVSKLVASIRNGSVGKWGDAPMPPFAALTDAQVKALAEFVLKQ